MHSNPSSLSGLELRAQRPATLMDDLPVDITTNLVPDSIDVVTHLAEDSLIAEGIDFASGDRKVAPFSNPFTASEELLYVDEENNLLWARHVNPDAGADPGGVAGWVTERLQDGIPDSDLQVVLVVHQSGGISAFTSGYASQQSVVVTWCLVADPSAPAGCRWTAELVAEEPRWNTRLNLLPVYYCNNRPATPVVFVDVPEDNELWWIIGDATEPFPGGEYSPPFHLYGPQKYDPADKDAAKVAGLDSPDLEFSQRPAPDAVRMYSLVEKEHKLYVSTWLEQQGLFTREEIATGVGSLVGPWTYPTHAGALFTTESQSEIGVAYRGEIPVTAITQLDAPLQDVAAWQDAEGLLHVYGRDQSSTLRVLHQQGWSKKGPDFPDSVLMLPDWETHGGTTETATTRALVADVATFTLDAYPDDMPSQHVRRQGGPSAESSVLYTQDLRTSAWHVEKMRVVPQDLPTPYTVARYETTLTVTNAFGTPVGGCQVSLTADAPVDLEVDGAFYRTGTVAPVNLVTNGIGQVTLRVVATALAMPMIHVTVPGMAQSLTVQVASDVHKFLAGNGTLPNHQEGFTTKAVLTATNDHGGRLFPGIAGVVVAEEAAWPPSAQDLVDWCQGVFAVQAGSPLPARMHEGLAAGEQVAGFTFQVHDLGRRGLEVHGGREQLDARRQALLDQGVADELENWFGDVWQGIQQGVTQVVETTINLLDETIELVIELADGVRALFVAAWDSVVSAAHAVEAVFVSVGAKIEEAIAWLRWAFDFRDALIAAKALRGVMDEAPRLITQTLTEIGTFADAFFIEKEAEVRTYFETLKTAFAGRSFSSLQGTLGAVPTDSMPDPAVSSSAGLVQGPHARWFLDKAVQAGPDPTSAASAAGESPFAVLMNTFVDSVSGADAFEDLSAVLLDLSELVGNLFSGKDPESLMATEMVTLLDLAEHLVIGILKLLDDIVNEILTWSEEAVAHFATILNDTSIADVPFIKLIWEFMISQAQLPEDDYPLTLGMFGAFFAAYPFTLVYKASTGKAPWPDGKIPTPPAIGEAWEVGQDLTTGLLAFQMLQGVVQTLDLVLDGWLDARAMWPEAVGAMPSFLTRGFALIHGVAYIIGDYPWFWGYDTFSKNQLPYFRYALTFFFNAYDLFASYEYEELMAMMEGEGDHLTPEEKELRATVYMLATAAFGWIRIGINLAEYKAIPYREDNQGRPATWFDTWNLWINLTAYVQTATGFTRFVFKRFPNTVSAIALIAKSAVDIAGDVYSGVCTVVQPGKEMASPVSIDAPEGDIKFPMAFLWQPYTSQAIPASGGWPSYDWSTWTTDDDPSPLTLPAGLEIVRFDYDNDLGRQMHISGVPTQVTTGSELGFYLKVEDGYGPSAVDRRLSNIKVVHAPSGIPVASFTASPTTGQAPLNVAFSDTSTGAPTEWYWSFGYQMDPSQEQVPVVRFEVADTYQVKLVAINQEGWSAPVTVDYVVTAPEGTPVADFSFSPSARAQTTVQFTDESAGDPTSWFWDFGNGQTSTERNPEIFFELGGTYEVSLVCSNANGQGVRKRQQLVVAWWT